MVKVSFVDVMDQNKKFQRVDICYSSRNAEFYVNIPSWMSGIISKNKITGETEYEVKNIFLEEIEIFKSKISKISKVIFYSFLSQVRPLDFDNKNNSAWTSQGEMCSKGVALDLWFRVGYVIDDPTEKYYNETYLDENGEECFWSGSSKVSHMKYTPQRELFFKEFREYLVTGIEKMKEFFHNNPDQVPNLIDNAMQQNLLPFKENKQE